MHQELQKAGLPIIPGSEGNIESLKDAKKVAKAITYPVMLKATFGGGGRGVRICRNEQDVQNQLKRVQSEALKSFGNAHIYMEKYIEHPRHIEVQILGSHHGEIVHLFERDCSIQRRHQKLVEIAPAPNLSSKTREKLYKYAKKAASTVGYTNAGTVEFMVDAKQNIYFLEMNTRLQVEHPITEEITGIDIVKEQINIANGKKLSFTQEDVKQRGVAIEFRINAEDPQNDFLPSFGRISRYYAPGGPGVRTDSAIYTGFTIPPDYDSLCAKLTVWSLDWPSALERAKRALNEMRMFGVKTTIPYYLEMLNSKSIREANLHTGIIDEHPSWLKYSNKSLPNHQAAVIAAAIYASS